MQELVCDGPHLTPEKAGEETGMRQHLMSTSDRMQAQALVHYAADTEGMELEVGKHEKMVGRKVVWVYRVTTPLSYAPEVCQVLVRNFNAEWRAFL